MRTYSTANDALREYEYWSARCREIVEWDPKRVSESYRAATQTAYRWLGRWEGRTERV